MNARWWQCVLPVVAFAADVTATLLGQPPEYWAGDRGSVIEGNPVARELLVVNPWLAVAAGVVYAFGFTLVVRYWRYGHLVALLLTASHTFGASCWLIRLGWPGWVGVVVLFFVMERVWAWCRQMAS
jgi:hypothetical protein